MATRLLSATPASSDVSPLKCFLGIVDTPFGKVSVVVKAYLGKLLIRLLSYL